MNPISHIDPIGTLILPVLAILFNSPIFFGWAKPVPVNSRNLKNPRTDMFWVALAGPVSNIFLALIGSLFLAFVAVQMRTSAYFTTIVSLLKMFVGMNLFLAFFNIIPLNPLDGGKVIARFLPTSLAYKLEQHEHISSMILMFLILTGALRFLAYPVEWTSNLFIGIALGIIG
jgi:Zn-dependent protease